MNAASKILTQGYWFRGELRRVPFSNNIVMLVLLFVVVFVSAISVIYLKNSERRLFSELQMLQRQASHIAEEKGKLLLEQSTWKASARVQQIAQQRLGMVSVTPSKVFIIERRH